MTKWPFVNGQTIIGWNLLEFIDWVEASDRALTNTSPSKCMPILALPPMQRTAVWRPKQVVDLWDSLMRGLPIGTFYLVEQVGGQRKVVTLTDDETREANFRGFDLLDGQQRVRALLVGAVGFKEEKRCLWVDLGAQEATLRPCLHLTSKAQPFGYDATTGQKLRLEDRRRARLAIELDKHKHEHPIQFSDGTEGPRRAYDLELFDGPVTQDGEPLEPRPPLPYRATRGQTFKLPELLRVWRTGPNRDAEGRIEALRAMVGEAPQHEALTALHEAFCRIEKAEVALLRVDPGSFRDRRSDLPALYDRIGAGGTPLVGEERLYSIYKYHAPYIRKVVNGIYDAVGRVLPPTKIAATALRVANAQDPQHPERNSTPSVSHFAEAMGQPRSELRQELCRLIPEDGRDGPFSRSFATAKRLLQYAPDAGDFWIPDVLLASLPLPLELWQVLVFWASRHNCPLNQKLCREEAVRFALFWYFCVWDTYSYPEKAAIAAFKHLRTIEPADQVFPGHSLYKRLIGMNGAEACAHALIPPDEFKRKLYKDATPKWRSDAERFVENNGRNDIGSQWWWNGKKMLPWLQREYIKRVFPGYAPLTDHEDDLPYDLDHICPYNDWGNWWSVQQRFENVEQILQRKMQDGRDAIGNGIGNLRLVESSTNRHDQDADFSEKMSCVVALDEPVGEFQQALADWAFPSEDEHRALWRRVSRPGRLEERKWNDDRLEAFQLAVEHRAAWLYRRFHDDLDYGSWNSIRADNNSLG